MHLWPVTAKGTLALSLHVTDLTWVPFRHSSSSQVVIICYRIVEWDIPWCFLPLSNNSPTPFAPHYYKLQCTSLLWTHYYCKYLCWQSLSHFHCTIHDVAFHTRVIVVLILINRAWWSKTDIGYWTLDIRNKLILGVDVYRYCAFNWNMQKGHIYVS